MIQCVKGKYLEKIFGLLRREKMEQKRRKMIWERKMSRCVTDKRTDKIVKIGLEFWTQNSQYFSALFAALQSPPIPRLSKSATHRTEASQVFNSVPNFSTRSDLIQSILRSWSFYGSMRYNLQRHLTNLHIRICPGLCLEDCPAVSLRFV